MPSSHLLAAVEQYVAQGMVYLNSFDDPALLAGYGRYHVSKGAAV